MPTQITDETRVRDLWEKLRRQMQHAGTDVAGCHLVHRGGPGAHDSTVHWISELQIWGCFRDDVARTGNRYWNAFGTGHPYAGDTLHITCEICIPLSGVNRRIAGAFGEGQDGTVYLLHSGKIGGGKEGVGKNAFLAQFHGTRQLLNGWKK